MRFWELVSTCREDPQLLQRLGSNPGWAQYLSWYGEYNSLVRTQDRSKLDAEVPDEACLAVLSGLSTPYYLSGGYVRTRPAGGDEQLTAAEVFTRFGGSFLEEVNEAGLARV